MPKLQKHGFIQTEPKVILPTLYNTQFTINRTVTISPSIRFAGFRMHTSHSKSLSHGHTPVTIYR